MTQTQRSPTMAAERAIAQFSSSRSACFITEEDNADCSCVSKLSSRDGQTAIDHERGAGDIARGGACQEYHRGRELVWISRSTGRHPRELAVDVTLRELISHF